MKSFGIVVGGGPAPGINGVIGAATIVARRQGGRVVGVQNGFSGLMRGDVSQARELHIEDVSRIHLLGGSILGTSRANPTRDPAHMRNVVEALRALSVDYLISIGGDDTCYSAREVAKAANGAIGVVHVPKTIDNDLPLPPGVPTFGFETARAEATRILTHLMEDARTSGRWFLAVLMGRSAGHLALGAARAAGTTLALTAEEFADGSLTLDDVAAVIEAAVVKRLAMGRKHGVAVVAEGIGARLDAASLTGVGELPRDEYGHLRLAELPLGMLLARRVGASLADMGIKMTITPKNIGYELRCVPPNAFDIGYTRDLGAGAVLTLLSGVSDIMITRQNEEMVPIPFDEILDPRTGKTRVRMLDGNSASVRGALALQVRLGAEDLAVGGLAVELERVTGLDTEGLKARYRL